jgi:hypothetical protein
MTEETRLALVAQLREWRDRVNSDLKRCDTCDEFEHARHSLASQFDFEIRYLERKKYSL